MWDRADICFVSGVDAALEGVFLLDRCIKTGLMHETRLFSINKTQLFQKENVRGSFFLLVQISMPK